MPRRTPSLRSFTNSLFAWQALGLRVAETMVASSHVISHRTRRNNSPAQLFEMGNEKVQAAIESSHALSRHWMALADRGPAAIWGALPVMFATSLAPFHARAVRNARRIGR